MRIVPFRLRRVLFVAIAVLAAAVSQASAQDLVLELTPEAREKLAPMEDLTLEWALYRNT